MAEQEQKIRVRRNGPYLVTGEVPLKSKQPVMSEYGEPLTWRTEEIDDGGRSSYALCRCGASGMKPFCDGTHVDIEFDGTETASTEPYNERRQSLSGIGIEVFDDRGICVHAGFCGNQVTNVWKMAPKSDDSTVRSHMIAMIERCPSGALTYEVDGEIIEPSVPVEISVTPDGPLWVTGGIPVSRSDGEMIETRNRVTLCRCGASATKPLCDGAHKEIGWTDAD